MFLMLIRWNEKGRAVLDFLLPLQGFESFHSDLPRVRWYNLVCVECLSKWWLVFVYWGLMLLWVRDVITLAQLFQDFMDRYIKP